MSKVNKSYIEGSINYIQEHHKDLDEKINNADDRINEVWKECNDGEASIEGFKEALASYKNLYLQATELYRRNAESADKFYARDAATQNNGFASGSQKPVSMCGVDSV